jgi:hypothetical protein
MRMAAVLVLSATLFVPAAQAQPAVPGLPDAIAAGEARFTFLGLRVYHARLWVAPGFRQSTLGSVPLALELAYERSFRAADIARRSLQEMERAGPLDPALAQRWEARLRELLPDVKPGDRLLGVHEPGRGAAFFHDGRLLGRVDDDAFSRRFFAIWLGPATSAPDLRASLLAGTAP